MKIKLIFLFLFFSSIALNQGSKGTIKVKKNTLAGIYVYNSEGEMKTYIRIFKDSTAMLANNKEGLDYMDFWFDRMLRDSNLPKGKVEIYGSDIKIEIKVAQSKEDNIILNGTFFEEVHLKLHRVGKDYDNKEYIFYKKR